MFSAGGQVPTHTVAPASASAFAIAKPNPPSSATPTTNARREERSIFSTAGFISDLVRQRKAVPARLERSQLCSPQLGISCQKAPHFGVPAHRRHPPRGSVAHSAGASEARVSPNHGPLPRAPREAFSRFRSPLRARRGV